MKIGLRLQSAPRRNRTSRGLHPKAARRRNRTRDRRQAASRMVAVGVASRTGGTKKGTRRHSSRP